MLSQADEARTKTNMAGAKEKVQLEVAGSYGTDGKIDPVKLEKNLQNLKGSVTEKEGYLYEVTVDGETFDILETGEVKETNTPQEPPFENTIKPGEKVKDEQGNTEYRNNGRAIIPVGFAIVPGCDDVSEGLVISDDANDTELDKNSIKANGNQFVWIPVNVTEENYKVNVNYVDTDASKHTLFDTDYLPDDLKQEGKTEEEVEKKLVLKEGIKGFYVSRYEAGDSQATEARTNVTEGKLVSKKNTFVYNWITQVDAKKKAKDFINNEYVKSSLISGVQWDMMMNFISSKPRKDGEGEDYIVTQPSNPTSNRHHVSGAEKSGQNEYDRVCNIYDLEGNCDEYIAEQNSYKPTDTYGFRGGNFAANACFSASNRLTHNNSASVYHAFRFILYVI